MHRCSRRRRGTTVDDRVIRDVDLPHPFCVAAVVRVMLHREASIRALHLVQSRSGSDAEGSIVAFHAPIIARTRYVPSGTLVFSLVIGGVTSAGRGAG